MMTVVSPSTLAPSQKPLAVSVPAGVKRLVVLLIRPTHYGTDGYPYRFALGVLPSNSLAVMYTLTRQALEQPAFAGLETEVYALEDSLRQHRRQISRLERRFPEDGTQVIVGLVGVQSSEFPRACHLLERWQRRGAARIIGGVPPRRAPPTPPRPR